MTVSVKELVSAFYADLWERRNAKRMRELLDQEFDFRGVRGETERGHDAFLAHMNAQTSGLTDYRVKVQKLVVEADGAFAKLRLRAQHTGIHQGFAPTGQWVEWDAATHLGLRDGRIASVWELQDAEGLRRRLEVLGSEAAPDLRVLPDGLPVPVDRGGADHLHGAQLPGVVLFSTKDEGVRLDRLERSIVFLYPRTGIPGKSPGETWDAIPGARGCTPQSCGFRDLHAKFKEHGVRVFGLSTQTTEFQRAFAEKNHVPFSFLSDSELSLTHALSLPTFTYDLRSVGGGGPNTLLERMAWYVDGGRIRKLWYPVFPPDENASRVLAWLAAGGRERL